MFVCLLEKFHSWRICQIRQKVNKLGQLGKTENNKKHAKLDQFEKVATAVKRKQKRKN